MDHAPNNNVKRYVNLCLMTMWREGAPVCQFVEGEPLPAFSAAGEVTPPDFDRLVNRLKIMCDLDPVRFAQPRTGRFEILVNSEPAYGRVEFSDTPGRRTLTVHLTRAQAAA